IIIFILLVYFIASVILLVIFRLLKSIIDSDILSTTDKMLGSLFSTIKAILIVMFLVYSFDTVSDYAVSISVKDSLSYSMILPKLYYYNVFMNFL
ncbi:MAG: CvpA family protein, partial [Peptostreptococcaceae bacterium]|nr:CvpA family protein [Peptostreptococcaceae bacterium]